MQELNLYEYAVIRLVPKVERGEYMNVGLVMLCKSRRWIKMDFHLNRNLFNAFQPDMEFESIASNLMAFQDIAKGTNKKSVIADLEAHERFRWLTAVRSSVLQTSRPHVGKCEDLETTFVRLFEVHVL